MRKIWRLYRLVGHTRCNNRQKGILDGLIKPSLGREEYLELLNVFDTFMLNSFAQSKEHSREDILRLATSMTDLPVSENTKGAVWAAMASSLDPNGLRRELKDLVPKIDINRQCS